MPGGWGGASDNTWEGKGEGERLEGRGEITPGRESGKDYGGGKGKERLQVMFGGREGAS